MHNPGTHSLKQTFNKWLFAFALLASVFAFSGLSISPQAGPSPVQCTWIIRSVKPAFKGIPFSTRKPDFVNSCSKYHTALFIAGLSLLRSKSDATRLKLCRHLNLSSAHKMPLGVLKTIPQSGKADPSVLV